MNALWVLDTSVAAGWFFSDELSHEDALSVRAHVAMAPERYVVPSLFHSELVHILARRSGRDARFVAQALQLVMRLGIRTLPLSKAAFLRTVCWTCERSLSGYDATYVALAEDLQGRWLTADVKAAKIAGSLLAATTREWKAD